MFNEENISSVGRAHGRNREVVGSNPACSLLYFLKGETIMANFMERFKEYLKFDEEYLGGPHKVYKFPNNYGASVIQNDYSYGGERGLWEIAVIYFVDGNEWDIDYSTPITSDVLGYLTDEEVCETLEQIKNL